MHNGYTYISENYINKNTIYDNQFTNSKGSITINKFDKKNTFVYGTFHFEAKNANGDGTKVVVTEGRFDKKYL